MKKCLLIGLSFLSAHSVFGLSLSEARQAFARNWECLFSKNPQPACSPDEMKRARIAAGLTAATATAALIGGTAYSRKAPFKAGDIVQFQHGMETSSLSRFSRSGEYKVGRAGVIQGKVSLYMPGDDNYENYLGSAKVQDLIKVKYN